MANPTIVDEFMAPLLAGNRTACRDFVFGKLAQFENPVDAYSQLLWPSMEKIEKLYKGDRINTATEHMATRIHRAIADQLQVKLHKAPSIGKKIVIMCAEAEPEELGAQMCSDLFESSGWEVYFLGGGVPNDEVLTLIGQIRPEILLIFGTQPAGVPGVRRLNDMIREIGVNPTMNIMVAGGVFNRADGLWKEVNADIIAKNMAQALPLATAAEPKDPSTIVKPTTKKRRRRRRLTPLAVAEGA